MMYTLVVGELAKSLMLPVGVGDHKHFLCEMVAM